MPISKELLQGLGERAAPMVGGGSPPTTHPSVGAQRLLGRPGIA